MQTEEELVNHLEDVLIDKLKFQTYTELVITAKHLDLQSMINQEQLRIDLAGINSTDSTIHFFEAETQLHVKHPIMYRNFCDYCYLLCPEEVFDSLPSVTKREQVSWAEEAGLGIITGSKEGAFRIRLHAKQQTLLPEVRKEVIRMMNKRYRIRFSTLPLWERSRKSYRE
ncbi:MAG: hypothetical protein ACFFAE_20805 [Candidatus Hodarchaeota archaeon]